MPYFFDFDSDNGILLCRLQGHVTDEIFKEFFRVGAQHAVRTQPSAGVVDLSGVTAFEVSTQTIHVLARSTPVLRSPSLRRIVVAPSAEIYGMMRMFEIEAEAKRPNLHVVRSEQEAWAILAVQNPPFKPLEVQ
jgi:hypothetical protein